MMISRRPASGSFFMSGKDPSTTERHHKKGRSEESKDRAGNISKKILEESKET